MTHSWFPTLGAVLLSFSLTACVSVTKSFPEKHHYILDLGERERAAEAIPGPALRINKLRVSPRFEGKGLVYRRGTWNYETDFYNEFLIPPGSILTEEVRQWLEASGLFQYVTDTAGQMQPSTIMEGTVAALYGDFRNESSPRAVMEIEFYLLQDRSARSEILFRKDYSEAVPLKEASPESLVEGWNEALRRILTALENDLRADPLRVATP